MLAVQVHRVTLPRGQDRLTGSKVSAELREVQLEELASVACPRVDELAQCGELGFSRQRLLRNDVVDATPTQSASLCVILDDYFQGENC